MSHLNNYTYFLMVVLFLYFIGITAYYAYLVSTGDNSSSTIALLFFAALFLLLTLIWLIVMLRQRCARKTVCA